MQIVFDDFGNIIRINRFVVNIVSRDAIYLAAKILSFNFNSLDDIKNDENFIDFLKRYTSMNINNDYIESGIPTSKEQPKVDEKYTDKCDTKTGPCSCGAWHGSGKWETLNNNLQDPIFKEYPNIENEIKAFQDMGIFTLYSDDKNLFLSSTSESMTLDADTVINSINIDYNEIVKDRTDSLVNNFYDNLKQNIINNSRILNIDSIGKRNFSIDYSNIPMVNGIFVSIPTDEEVTQEEFLSKISEEPVVEKPKKKFKSYKDEILNFNYDDDNYIEGNGILRFYGLDGSENFRVFIVEYKDPSNKKLGRRTVYLGEKNNLDAAKNLYKEEYKKRFKVDKISYKVKDGRNEEIKDNSFLLEEIKDPIDVQIYENIDGKICAIDDIKWDEAQSPLDPEFHNDLFSLDRILWNLDDKFNNRDIL